MSNRNLNGLWTRHARVAAGFHLFNQHFLHGANHQTGAKAALCLEDINLHLAVLWHTQQIQKFSGAHDLDRTRGLKRAHSCRARLSCLALSVTGIRDDRVNFRHRQIGCDDSDCGLAVKRQANGSEPRMVRMTRIRMIGDLPLRALNHQDPEARNVFEVLPVSSENLQVMLNGHGGNPDILSAVCAGGSPTVQEGG